MPPGLALRRLVDDAVLRLRTGGLRLAGARDLPNGIQASFASGDGTTCRLNFYHSSRKGFSVVPAGGDPALSGRAEAILAGNPVVEGALGDGGSRIGSDEAGKGDYMGPLTVAAVFAPPSGAELLRAMGVADSKRLADGRIRGLSREISGRRDLDVQVMAVAPPEYNRRMESLSASGRNSLHLLAELHAGAVAALLARGADPDRVVIDRFCPASRMRPLLPPGRYRLEMPVGGEADPVVAAASILARNAYLEGLDAIANRWGMEAAAGAGAPTDLLAGAFVLRHGPGVLREIAKLHFRNTEKILAPGCLTPRSL